MKIEVRKPAESERKEAFSWHYDEKETCLLLDGEATVETANEKVSFKSGDYVIFPAGLDCVWNIKKAVRKHYKLG